jgi:hypothetical protein
MLVGIVVGHILWPFVTLYFYLLFWIGVVIALFPSLFVLITNPKKLFNICEAFKFLSKLPLGKRVFSGVIGSLAPYSASISPIFSDLKLVGNKLTSVVYFDEQQWLRNPYSSVHAIALSNLGELSSGICVFAAMEYVPNVKGIPVKISMEYYKKGRGRMTATSTISLNEIIPNTTCIFESLITNGKQELIAKCMVTWTMSDSDKKMK